LDSRTNIKALRRGLKPCPTAIELGNGIAHGLD
jgi:hypothetical protein